MKYIDLSNGEWKIMNLLWESSPRTITMLTADLKEKTGWTKHTVITMLSRMEKKGAVRFEEGSRAKQYYPNISKEQVSYTETKGFLDKVYNGSLSMMVNAMVKQDSLTKDEIDELYGILKKAEEEKYD
ncbi:BlaI family penicillinase repressor [Mobilisporobacter senegalensis]|uniref:BlaI family penicillinase repressor n=1 Tax=Mobilisporobacter senegalensis TaxID=1329262 RepID=A0A3N1XPT1_9FIRM|nr:BlaI/MecI/CopY family transcriptional regulator [Mobilisporobacter senegalensis]ROR28268.1 BlaI family penicillinase repressor [Mobilisporobacter senegalensis]